MIKAVLTIDDIASENTPAIVDYLNENGIQAIMFGVGENIERHYDEAVYALRGGMIVGNHSYSHPHFSELTFEEGASEIKKCEEILNKLYRDAGVKRAFRPFRFPYGDKGGDNEKAYQDLLKDSGFDKVDDRPVPWKWWRDIGCAGNIDTYWTYDFEEYRVRAGSGFTREDVLAKMQDKALSEGAPLFEEDGFQILLTHAHDETDALWPGYYREMIGRMLEKGVRFVPPEFI